MLKINGEEKEAAGQTVADYLASSGFNLARVVVELNEAIVPKGRYAETTLRDGDQVEIGGDDKYVALCRRCWRDRRIASANRNALRFEASNSQ